MCDDREIALHYFKQAQALYASREFKEAEKLLKSSYEFYPDYSETTYLLALILFRDQQTTLDGLRFLKEALEDNSWTKTDPYSAVRELGRVYLQINLPDQARIVLEGIGIKLKEDLHSALLLAKTYKALLNKGIEPRQFEDFLSDSLKRFPSSVDFYILYAEYLSDAGMNDRALGIIYRGLEKLPDNKELLLERIKLTDDNEEVVALFESYFQSGGDSPESYVLALSRIPDNREEYLNLYFTRGGNSDILYLDQIISVIREQEELFTLFKEKESTYTGRRIVDENRDGFFEEVYVYTSGKLDMWERDGNQDGIPEVIIEFKDNAPELVRFKNGSGNEMIGTYSTYPYIESFTFRELTGAREYLLLPLHYSYSLFTEMPPEIIYTRLPVKQSFILPDKEDIQQKAFRVYEYNNGIKNAAYEFLNGEYISIAKDTDNNGIMDHILEYKNGNIHKGKRDLDGDGIFEIMEYYTNGTLAQITYDQNNDDNADCTQFFDTSGKIRETYWDYNSDGTIDAKEIMKNGSEVVFLFSTGYDGLFDLEVIFRDGRVVSSRRGTKQLTITPGTKKGIYWIGKPGKNFDVTIVAGNGLYTSNGTMYFVFKYSDSIYIEELK